AIKSRPLDEAGSRFWGLSTLPPPSAPRSQSTWTKIAGFLQAKEIPLLALPVRRCLIVLLQQVLAVIITRIPEHGMDVVAVAPFAAGAGVVVFDQDRRTVHAIINRAPGIDGSHPREMDLADAFALDLPPVRQRGLRRLIVHVLVDEGPQQ